MGDENNTHLRIKISKHPHTSSDNISAITSPENNSNQKKKKKIKPMKPVKFIRFDNHNHAPYSNDASFYPSLGDIVTCDIIHYRRTQTYAAINLSFIQRVNSYSHRLINAVTIRIKPSS